MTASRSLPGTLDGPVPDGTDVRDIARRYLRLGPGGLAAARGGGEPGAVLVTQLEYGVAALREAAATADGADALGVEMTQLVDDILFLSELEQGREVVALGFTELAPHVLELYEESRERALRAELTLEADVPAGLVVPLRPRMLQVVLGNLLDNALRYARPRSDLPHRGAPGGRHGAARGVRRRGGSGFVRRSRACSSASSAPMTRTTRGTGLGLAIVKHIITAADGTAEVGEGALGEGTRFRFALPAPRAARIL